VALQTIDGKPFSHSSPAPRIARWPSHLPLIIQKLLFSAP
jgi:hypothetical protein